MDSGTAEVNAARFQGILLAGSVLEVTGACRFRSVRKNREDLS